MKKAWPHAPVRLQISCHVRAVRGSCVVTVERTRRQPRDEIPQCRCASRIETRFSHRESHPLRDDQANSEISFGIVA